MSSSVAVRSIKELEAEPEKEISEESLALKSNDYNVALNNTQKQLDQEKLKSLAYVQ